MSSQHEHSPEQEEATHLFYNNQGEPIKFYLSRSLPGRTALTHKIEARGGEIVNSEHVPGAVKIGDPNRPQFFDKDYTSPNFIDDSISNGYLQNIGNYRIVKQSLTPQAIQQQQYVPVIQPSKGTGSRGNRVDFTLEDDDLLRRIVHRADVATSGNKIYKIIAEKYGKHSFHSWRDRYVRHLRPKLGIPQPGDEAILNTEEAKIISDSNVRKGQVRLQPDGSHKIAQSSIPKQRQPSQIMQPELADVAQLDPALSAHSTPARASGRGRAPFTSTEDHVLIDAVRKHGDHAKTYVALAQQHASHTWQSWKERVKTLKRKNGGHLPVLPELHFPAEHADQMVEYDESVEGHEDGLEVSRREEEQILDPELQATGLDQVQLATEGFIPSISQGALEHHDHTDDFDGLTQGGAFPFTQMTQNSDLAQAQLDFHINDPSLDETLGAASQFDDEEAVQHPRKRAKVVLAKRKAPATPSQQVIKASQPEDGRAIHHNRAKATTVPVPAAKESRSVKKQPRSSQLPAPTRTSRVTRSASVMSDDDVMAASQLQSGRQAAGLVAETAQKPKASGTRTRMLRNTATETPEPTPRMMRRPRGEPIIESSGEESVEEDAEVYSQSQLLGESHPMDYMNGLDVVNEDEEESFSATQARRDTWAALRVARTPGVTMALAIRAWQAAFGVESLAEECLNLLRKRRSLPIKKGVWLSEDDDAIRGEDEQELERVQKKHGKDAIFERLEFLNKLQNAA